MTRLTRLPAAMTALLPRGRLAPVSSRAGGPRPAAADRARRSPASIGSVDRIVARIAPPAVGASGVARVR